MVVIPFVRLDLPVHQAHQIAGGVVTVFDDLAVGVGFSALAQRGVVMISGFSMYFRPWNSSF